MVTARTTSISLQGEDGIRAKLVTAVQTCALPIYSAPKSAPLGMVSFVVSTSPSGSSSAVAPNPCTLTPGTTSSTCLRSEEHTSELQSLAYLVCRLLLEKKKKNNRHPRSTTT